VRCVYNTHMLVGEKLEKTAVIIPCLNEAVTVASVVRDFAGELPGADIYVYDNGSEDDTIALAKGAGAEVSKVMTRGKGAVMRRAFTEIEADYYVVVDGDGTYPACYVRHMLDLCREGADMVCGDRLSNRNYKRQTREWLHSVGNHVICNMISFVLGVRIKDALTGYRVMRRRFVKNCPILSDGFEVETEMTIHAVEKKFQVLEIPIDYLHRPPGSQSKLRTFHDGLLILRTIAWVGKDSKPLKIFGLLSVFFLVLSLFAMVMAAPLGWALPVIGFSVSLSLAICALILDTVSKQNLQDFAVRLLNFK